MMKKLFTFLNNWGNLGGVFVIAVSISLCVASVYYAALSCSRELGYVEDKWEQHWKEIFKTWEEKDGPNLPIIVIDKWIFIRSDKDLDSKKLLKEMGHPKDHKKIVVHGKGEERPRIYKMYFYDNVIFVEWDLSPNPGSIEFMMIRR